MKKLTYILIVVAIAGGAFYYWQSQNEAESKLPVIADPSIAFDCVEGKATDFNCYRTFYFNVVETDGIKIAFADLKKRYEQNSYVVSQCHQIVHVIGFGASKKFETVADAYKEGDAFCWSGYYHGVLEGLASRIGFENLVRDINNICAPLAAEARYSFNHYNCAHGIGHGIMAINDSALFDSLEICNGLTDSWERSSCWGGAFMENVMVDNRYHQSKYLKPEDPMYPCNAVDEKYKSTCYLMQTSYALSVLQGSFEKVFELCSTIEPDHRNTCYQSLGRDASGRSVSDVAQTKEWCYLGEGEQRQNCIIGAVKDFISYFHSDTEAKELCASLDEKSLQDICHSTAESYYQTF